MKAQQIECSYTVWKEVVQANSFIVYWVVDSSLSEQGTVYAGTDEYIYIARIVDDTWEDFNTVFPAGIRIDCSREGDALAKIIGVDSVRAGKYDGYGHQIATSAAPTGSRIDVISVDWCDKTTWYPESTRIEDETLTDSGDGLTFNSVNGNWIDTTHGKITNENFLNGDYVPVIKANGVVKEEDLPFGGDQKDFTVNYVAGSVTFHEAPTTPVVATYSKANGSFYIIQPNEGTILRILVVEVQFAQNIVLTDAITFQPFGLVDVFAPHLTPDPYPSGTKIPIKDPTIYKTMLDYINEAAGSYPAIPASGGTHRGIANAIHIYRWPYAERASTDLVSSYGMEIRVGLQNNVVFNGDHAVATFYGISENE